MVFNFLFKGRAKLCNQSIPMSKYISGSKIVCTTTLITQLDFVEYCLILIF